jgi:tetratricopeptide (TPR) repeat protein
MDCEKFDRIVLDLMYGELDELTEAAAKRHIEHCSRCKAVTSGLRATREVGALALVDPPASLELGILDAERRLNAKLPLRKKAGRAVSILAVYAMRPQLAMAALLLLMIGSSLFFLRGRPGARDSVLITERGVPETEAEHVAIRPAPERSDAPAALASAMPKLASAKSDAPGAREREADKPSEAVAGPAEAAKDGELKGAAAEAEPLPGTEPAADSMDAATAAFQGGRYVEAQRRFEEIAARGGSEAPAAALQAVEALRRQRGCPAAAPRYEEVHSRYRETPSGNEAAWQAGDCYRALGELSQARQSLEALLEVAEYHSRAEAALQELTAREEQVASAKKAKAAVGAGAPAAAPVPASPPAAAPAKPKASP